MARPTTQVLTLLELLQSGGIRTMTELAGRLSVDERTVRRYVDHLSDLGVPVESVRGRHGGYRLAPGYRMPPLMLDDDEALAVLLGLVAGHRAGLITAASTAGQTASAKIRRVQGTTGQIRARLPASVATIEEPPAAEHPSGGEPPSAEVLQASRWHRVEVRAERLDWLPPVLASLDLPFAIEQPDELRGLVIAFADRLRAFATTR
jgi:predicted DNA-binding transcriptional regulator YafY